MHVLVIGGYGFIGEAIVRALHAAGHRVTGMGRAVARAERRMPFARWVGADLRDLQTPEDWQTFLAGIDAVVNAAGALQDGGRDDLAAVQARAMFALYAAASVGTRPLIVQISANTAGPGDGLPFLATKRVADEALKASGLPHVILRPALVIGRNAHGGTALVRALAAFPGAAPLVHPDARVQTVALDDVAAAVVAAVAGRIAPDDDLALAHPLTVTLRDLVTRHRAWFGLPPARALVAPQWLAGLAARAADLAGRLGWRSPLRSTALAIMAGGVTANRESLRELHDSLRETTESPPQAEQPIHLKSLDETLAANPAGAQDLWFARLYLLKPVLIAGLALFWIASGLVALAEFSHSAAYLDAAGLRPGFEPATVWSTSLADLGLGLLVLWRRFAKPALVGMIALPVAYLAAASILMPALWLDPLGPLVKVVPSILLAVVALAILDER